MDFYKLSKAQALSQVDSKEGGLSSEEAKKRLLRDGENKVVEVKRKSKIVKFLEQFKDLMIIILLVASIISITIGAIEGQSSEIIDGGIILAIVILNAIMGFIQENKAERAMDALKRMTEPEASVLRDGQVVQVQSNKLVLGDIVVLDAGDIVPADLRLIETASLSCDESSLTGESHSASKNADIVCKGETVLGDRCNMAYSGSVVSSGRGTGVVVGIGRATEMGKIAKIIEETEKDDTPLQKSIKAISKLLTILVLIIAAVVFMVEVFARPDAPLIEAFLTAVAIAVAAIPESMPAVITIIMSMGVSRLAKNKAIVKRLHAVETLGSCNVICSDKTGTITQNRMTVKAIYLDGMLQSDSFNTNSDSFDVFMRTMVLCNDSKKSKGKYVGDPTETALCDFASKFGYHKNKLDKEYERIGEVPFDSNRKLMSTLNRGTSQGVYGYVKGATDMLLERCDKILVSGKQLPLTNKLKMQIISANKKMGDGALRVLGIAVRKASEKEADMFVEGNLTFIGLVGMIDPPRKEVVEAVKKCKKAHMRPIMITGDHKDTAFAIANQVGICENIKQVMTGAELDNLSAEDFAKILDNIRVFARVSPENKVRIVEAFKKKGNVVAMTGDGVNDAPSMKMSSIGVGMGITGTDVTKEVADMIVTDDNFATIVVAVEEGRKIYDNIQKTVKFLFSANMAELSSLFLATMIFPKFAFLLPVQILFVNLITDSLPAIGLGLEPAEKDIMERPPRDSTKSFFSGGNGTFIIYIGLVQTLLMFSSYVIGLEFFSPEIAMSMAFYSLNIIQMFFLYSIRTNDYIWKSNPFKNKWVNIAVLSAFTLLAIIAFTPIHTILGLKALNGFQFGVVIGLSVAILIFAEGYKFVQKRISKRKDIGKNEKI